MPYTSNSQLPDSIRNNLPEKAQMIFVRAFNQASAKLKPGEDEVPAFKVGGSAVKNPMRSERASERKKFGESLAEMVQ